MLGTMNGHRTFRIGQLLLKMGGVAIGLVVALIATFRDLLSAVEVEHDNDRRLHDADMVGEYNHRTGRLDAGTDPYGWYDEE